MEIYLAHSPGAWHWHLARTLLLCHNMAKHNTMLASSGVPSSSYEVIIAIMGPHPYNPI
jgi:hypothetical protein